MTAGEQDRQQITAVIESSIIAGLPPWTQRHLFASRINRGMLAKLCMGSQSGACSDAL